MKKILFVTIILVIILTSCNLPATKTTPSADIIATRVAGTMAASQTAAAVLQPTSALPTVAQETATPEPTATATITPTATINLSDPKLALGKSDFTFNSATSGNPFGLVGSPSEDEFITISQEVGGVTFASKAINGGKRWRLSAPTPTNFYLEGTFLVNTCSGKDNYGLTMGVPTYQSKTGYFVGLSCDGNYIVDWIDTSENGHNLITWTPDPNIKTGGGQVNRLGVMVLNNTFKIYINGVLAKEFSDDSLPTTGHIGAYISARENSHFTVQLQELLEWDQ